MCDLLVYVVDGVILVVFIVLIEIGEIYVYIVLGDLLIVKQIIGIQYKSKVLYSVYYVYESLLLLFNLGKKVYQKRKIIFLYVNQLILIISGILMLKNLKIDICLECLIL